MCKLYFFIHHKRIVFSVLATQIGHNIYIANVTGAQTHNFTLGCPHVVGALLTSYTTDNEKGFHFCIYF